MATTSLSAEDRMSALIERVHTGTFSSDGSNPTVDVPDVNVGLNSVIVLMQQPAVPAPAPSEEELAAAAEAEAKKAKDAKAKDAKHADAAHGAAQPAAHGGAQHGAAQPPKDVPPAPKPADEAKPKDFGPAPVLTNATVGVGFTVQCGAGDYNYVIAG